MNHLTPPKSLTAEGAAPGSFLSSFGLGLLSVIIAAPSLHLWSETGPVLFHFLTGAAIAVAFVGAGMFRSFSRTRSWFPGLRGQGFAVALALLFFSDWMTRGYNLFQGPSIRGELLLATALCLATLNHGRKIPWGTILLFAIALGIYGFVSASKGRLIYSDDHPTFLYRLLLLRENFPAIPFFSPLWNGGLDARDFFATGTLNVFLLFSPVIYLTELVSSYNLVPLLTLFLITPLATFWGAREGGLPRPAAALAALLAICSSLTWYRWALKYGTMGFLVSAALFPLVVIIGARLISAPQEATRRRAAVFLTAGSLMVMWSLAGVAVLPLILLALFRIRSLLRVPILRFLAIALLVVNLPWIMLFLKVSRVGGFLNSEQVPVQYSEQLVSQAADPNVGERGVFKARASSLRLSRAKTIVSEHAVATNPLILLFVLPGLALLRREIRTPIVLTLGWLFVLGILISQLKPQLELDRMLVMAALLAAIPAALSIHGLLEGFRSMTLRRGLMRLALIPSALTGGFALVSPFVMSSITHNRTIEQFHFAEPLVKDLAQAIETYGGEGRTLFSGFILHELNQGHLAPLVYLTGKPLIASTFVHNLWRYRQIVPASFLAEGTPGIERFFDLYNVTAVVAHEVEWRSYFLREKRYRKVWQEGIFTLFERAETAPSYFLEGDGQITAQTSSRVVFTLVSSDATLKFNYFPFLEVRSPDGSSVCSINPAPVSPAVVLTRLSNCPVGVPLSLESISPLRRLLSGGPP